MKFTENTGLVLEICKVMNLTVWKFITSMAGVLSSQLLPQMQVELEDYMQACIVRAPFLAALKSGTVDDFTARVSVMGAVTAEWRVNRRVRQLTAKLQREIMKRQVEEQHVPNCSAAWIYQDFPDLLSEAKAESFSISVLCDLILTRYDLTKDKEFRDLLHYVQSDLQRQNDQLNKGTQCVSKTSKTSQYPRHVPTDQRTQYVSKTNQYPRNVPTNQRAQSVSQTKQYPRNVPTTCAPHARTESSSLPVLDRADWFEQYQPAQRHTDVPLFGPTGLITDAETRARPTNCYRNHNGRILSSDSSRRNTSVNSYTRPMAKTTGYSRGFSGQKEQEEVPQFGHHHYTKTATAGSSDSRQSVRPHIQANKQTYNTQGRLPKPYKRADPKPKTKQQKKSFDQKLDDYLAKVCADTKQAEHKVTESKSPEFTSSHMGGLVIRIAKKPKSVLVTESEKEKELTLKKRKRQAFFEHAARVQYALSGNIKEEAETDDCKPYKQKPQCSSVSSKTKRDNLHSVGPTNTDNPRKRKVQDSKSIDIQNKRARVDTKCRAACPAITDNPFKRKIPLSSQFTSVQNKCARVDTKCKAAGSATTDNPRKRKTPDSSQCNSVQYKYARVNTTSKVAGSLTMVNPCRSKIPVSSKCTRIKDKYARLDTGSAVKAPKHSVAITNNPRKRKATDSSKCTSIQNKYARLDTGSAVKALKRHLNKRQN